MLLLPPVSTVNSVFSNNIILRMALQARPIRAKNQAAGPDPVPRAVVKRRCREGTAVACMQGSLHFPTPGPAQDVALPILEIICLFGRGLIRERRSRRLFVRCLFAFILIPLRFIPFLFFVFFFLGICCLYLRPALPSLSLAPLFKKEKKTCAKPLRAPFTQHSFFFEYSRGGWLCARRASCQDPPL